MLKFLRKSRQFGCFNLISSLKDCLEKKAVTVGGGCKAVSLCFTGKV